MDKASCAQCGPNEVQTAVRPSPMAAGHEQGRPTCLLPQSGEDFHIRRVTGQPPSRRGEAASFHRAPRRIAWSACAPTCAPKPAGTSRRLSCGSQVTAAPLRLAFDANAPDSRVQSRIALSRLGVGRPCSHTACGSNSVSAPISERMIAPYSASATAVKGKPSAASATCRSARRSCRAAPRPPARRRDYATELVESLEMAGEHSPNSLRPTEPSSL
jgi:hypothetical protein